MAEFSVVCILQITQKWDNFTKKCLFTEDLDHDIKRWELFLSKIRMEFKDKKILSCIICRPVLKSKHELFNYFKSPSSSCSLSHSKSYVGYQC